MAIDIAAIYEDLKKVSASSLKIDPKVGTISPAFLQEMTLECEFHGSTVERHELAVRQELDNAEHMLGIEKENYNIKHRSALIHNKSIKELPTGKEREAAVDELLEDERKNIVKLEDRVSILKNLSGAIKTVQQGISRKDGRVKVLMRLMDQQLNRLNVGLPDDPEVSELTKGLTEIDDLEDEMTPDDVESSAEYVEEDESGGESGTGHPETGTPEADSQDESEDAPDIISAFLEDDDSPGSISGDAEQCDPEESDSEEDSSSSETAQSEDEVVTPNETGTDAESTEAISQEEDSRGLENGEFEIEIDEAEETPSSEPESEGLPDIELNSEESQDQEVQTKEEVAGTPKTASSDSGEGIDIDAFLADFEE
ncbi:MAG: hypothetical protein GF334_06235 [Candidatus Altiarchaeales archaeon]|nr:hypothetical protein [Candidatus Altiarchaeales archaeon]